MWRLSGEALGTALAIFVGVASVPGAVRADGGPEERLSPEQEEAPVRADDAPEKPAPPEVGGKVSYDAVDEATVRVFSVGTVDVESYDHEGREVRVAVPKAGHGTGFAVSSDGLILTAHHVVEGARHVVVRLPGEGGFFAARVAHADEDADIAVLDVNADLPALGVPRDIPLRVRQTVYALGYPLDPTRTRPQSARGIVAGEYDDDTLQLDMSLNPGNSGGPLLDADDRVVGMVVARGDVELGVQGIGFAVANDLLASAAREAKRRLSAGQVAALGRGARLGAVVVDELLQKGALHELGEVTDLGEGLRSTELDRALEQLTSRIRDADLLAFISGVLWNAALAIETLGVREIGETTLSDAEALALAERLRRSSIDAAERAVEVDASVEARSGFLTLVLGSTTHRSAVTAERAEHSAATVDIALRLSPELRLNPAASGVGRGLALGVSLQPRILAREGDVTIVPVVGAAVGGISLDGEARGESFEHRFVSGEFGLAARLGGGDRHIELLAAYAPSWYTSAVESDGDRIRRASDLMWTHVRAAVGYRFHAFHIGVGARVMSGPTLWLEPLVVGFVASI